MKNERRYFPVELRVVPDDDGTTLRGHAAVFGSDSLDLGGFIEHVAPGAFAGSLRRAEENPSEALIHAFWNHDSGIPLGSTRSGKLALREDERGLAFELNAKRLTPAQLDAVQDGDMRMSFGFRTIQDKWEQRDGKPLRTLLDVELFEVSLVSQPAYPDTTVAVRSMEEWRSEAEPAVVPADLDPEALRVLHKIRLAA